MIAVSAEEEGETHSLQRSQKKKKKKDKGNYRGEDAFKWVKKEQFASKERQ